VTRGKPAQIGDQTENSNGYVYVRTAKGWRPKAHILAEDVLGRSLHPQEMVRFKDGDRKNLELSNLEVVFRKNNSETARIARLDAKIARLQALRASLIS
jgi:hypothetical protein